MSVPLKYRAIGDFHEYYSGRRLAPYLTLFVGGNHEASNYLQELYYGGWVAPRIYYLGAANLLSLGGLKIAGLSGIWKGYNYNKPHFERLPYTADEVKSIYHVREMDVRKLLLVRQQIDIGLSHDWPRGVEWHGNHQALFRQKNHFEADAQDGTLGSVAARYVLDRLRPPYWMAAHLHCKFSAVVRHTVGDENNAKHNADEIDLDLDDEDPSQNTGPSNIGGEPQDLRSMLPPSFAAPARNEQPTTITNIITKFLALDKCLPHRHFLQLLEIGPSKSEPVRFSYDPEWLAILRLFGQFDPHEPLPRDLGEAAYQAQLSEQRAWVERNIVESGKLDIPENFALTAPCHDGTDVKKRVEQPTEWTNPQTAAFCSLLGISNHFDASQEDRERRKTTKRAAVEANHRSAQRKRP